MWYDLSMAPKPFSIRAVPKRLTVQGIIKEYEVASAAASHVSDFVAGIKSAKLGGDEVKRRSRSVAGTKRRGPTPGIRSSSSKRSR